MNNTRARRTGQNRRRKTGGCQTVTKHSLDLNKLLQFSEIREEHFDGLEVVRTENEQRPTSLQRVCRIPGSRGGLFLAFKWLDRA
jgi:hypothetical protein